MSSVPASPVKSHSAASVLPRGFVYADMLIPGLCVDLAYFNTHNFIGERIVGYEVNRLVLTEAATLALRKAQYDIARAGLGLKVFDGYRPQRAVDRFVEWAHDPEDIRMRDTFYPHIAKERLFPEGYLLARSTHSRGSTLDLTLIDSLSHDELDMGTHFDFFDPLSWPSCAEVSVLQRANRQLLRSLMHKHGFVGVDEEWWHFTFRHEPFPDTYFDFVIC